MQLLKTVIFVLLLVVFGIVSSAIAAGGEIRLSAAASMSDVIKELAGVYRAAHPGVTILANLGPSGGLAKQIVQGAPADLFISANTRWMDYLVGEGMMSKKTVRFFAGNSLVFVGSASSGISSLVALPTLSRIAIGSPKSVPAGQYAEQAMRAAGIYDDLLAANKLVMAKDVRQALLYADRGEVDGAMVYKTDGLLAEQAVLLFTVPENLHEPIHYPMGLTKNGETNEAAQGFYTFLTGPEALTVLGKFGFSAVRP